MRIDKVIFSNFRNYKKIHEFKLNKTYNVLFGENGNGKSSFFDGLEWCLTGNISRFTSSIDPKRPLANKEIQINEECYVEIYFENFYLKRSFKLNENGFSKTQFSIFTKKSNGHFKKSGTGNENVDNELRKILLETGYEYRDKRSTVGEVVNKAYILSQDQVADFVSKEQPDKRYEALSSIMGFDDIVKFRKNLTMLLKTFTDKEILISKEVEDLKLKRDEFKSFLKNVDSSLLSDYEKMFNKNATSIEELNLLLDEKRNEINKIDILYNSLNKSKNSIVGSINKVDSLEDFEKIISDKNRLINSVSEQIEKKLIDINQKNEELKIIDGKISTLEKNEEEKKLYNKNVNKLSAYINKLSELDVDLNSLKNVKNNLENSRKNLLRIDFYKNNVKVLIESKKIISDHPANIINIKKNILSKEEKLKKLELKKLDLEQKLMNSNNSSSVKNLLNSIETIYLYVQSNDVNNVCPVCSSKVDEGINHAISKNVLKLIEETNNFKEKVNNDFKEKELLETEINGIINSILKKKIDLQNLDASLQKANQTLENIESNDLFSDYFKLNDKEIVSLNEELLKITSNAEEALAIEKKINVIKGKLNENDNLIDVSLGEFNHNDLKSKSLVIANEIPKLNKELNDLKQYQDEVKIFVHDTNNIKNNFEEQFNIYNVNSIEKLIDKILFKHKEIGSELDLMKSVIPSVENSHHNKPILNQIDKTELSIKQKKTILEKVKDKVKKVGHVSNIINDEYGNAAIDFLNSEKSEIQTYYKYLNPTPSKFNELDFEIKNNKDLIIKVTDSTDTLEKSIEKNKFSESASSILSSGQLNILALSIFIATNNAKKGIDFDFIAIDDPIQNMDDVNRFSVCDVLSNLNKQLIFSTHDQDFLNLFLKKNEYQLENIGLFSLDAEKNIYKQISLA